MLLAVLIIIDTNQQNLCLLYTSTLLISASVSLRKKHSTTASSEITVTAIAVSYTHLDDENRPTSLTYSASGKEIGQSTTTIDKLPSTIFTQRSSENLPKYRTAPTV